MKVNINQENVKRIIEENPVAFATTGAGNKPNVIAVAFAKVVSSDEIVIGDIYMKQTVENIKTNNHVCLATWDKDWNGYKFIGTSRYFTKGKWKKIVDENPDGDTFPKGAILIKVQKVIELK